MGAQPAAAITAVDYLYHIFPIFRWLPVYKWRQHGASDCIAGACLAMLAAPEALSYAVIAGLQPQYGLYTAFMAPLAYALVCSSPHLVTGPTTIMSILTQQAHLTTWSGATLTPDDYARICGTLALLCAALQMALSLLRAGVLTRLISPAVVLGFTSGSAFIIASTQFSTVLGVPKCVGDSGGSCTFAAAVNNVVEHGGSIQYSVPLASLFCIALLLGVKFITPRCLPRSMHVLSHTGPLLLLLIVTPLMYAFEATLAAHRLVPVGSIPAGLPTPTLPLPPRAGSSADIAALFAGALPCVLVGYMESLSIARTLARQYGPYSIDESQELFAIGFSNLAVSLLRGYPITGSFSRSAVNAGSGARSPLSSVFASIMLALALLLLTPALAYMPKVALAAIILVVIIRLIEPGVARAMYATSRGDFYVALVVFIITIFSNVTYGLYVGFASSWLLSLVRTYDTRAAVTVYAWTARDAVSAAEDSGARAVPMDRMPPARVWSSINSMHALHSVPTRTLAHVLVNADEPQLTPATTASTNGVDASWSHAASQPTPARTVVLAMGPDITFAHTERLALQVHEARQCYAPRVLILDARGWASMDFSGACGIHELATDVHRETAATPSSPALPACLLVVAGASADMVAQIDASAAADVHTHSHASHSAESKGSTPLLQEETGDAHKAVAAAGAPSGGGITSFHTLADALAHAAQVCNNIDATHEPHPAQVENDDTEDVAAAIPESSLTVAARQRRQGTEPLMHGEGHVRIVAARPSSQTGSGSVLAMAWDSILGIVSNAVADLTRAYAIASSSNGVLVLGSKD